MFLSDGDRSSVCPLDASSPKVIWTAQVSLPVHSVFSYSEPHSNVLAHLTVCVLQNTDNVINFLLKCLLCTEKPKHGLPTWPSAAGPEFTCWPHLLQFPKFFLSWALYFSSGDASTRGHHSLCLACAWPFPFILQVLAHMPAPPRNLFIDHVLLWPTHHGITVLVC